jgi:hypothetical protein
MQVQSMTSVLSQQGNSWSQIIAPSQLGVLQFCFALLDCVTTSQLLLSKSDYAFSIPNKNLSNPTNYTCLGHTSQHRAINSADNWCGQDNTKITPFRFHFPFAVDDKYCMLPHHSHLLYKCLLWHVWHQLSNFKLQRQCLTHTATIM